MPLDDHSWPRDAVPQASPPRDAEIDGSADPTSVVVLTDRSGVVAATLRFAGRGTEYVGARGGDLHLRAMLIEVFHHRKRAVAGSADTPFHHAWLRSHLHRHLHDIDPDLVASPPLPGNHPAVGHLVIGSPLPRALAQRFASAT